MRQNSGLMASALGRAIMAKPMSYPLNMSVLLPSIGEQKAMNMADLSGFVDNHEPRRISWRPGEYTPG